MTYQCDTATCAYDTENYLLTAGGMTYTGVYPERSRRDGDSRRAWKAGTTQPYKVYWYGMGSDPLTETDLSGTPSAEFIFFNGKRTARLDLPSGAVHHYFSDHLGSTRLLTAIDKSVFDSMDYLPFGEQIAGDTGSSHKFTSKERDSESGLDNFGARYNSSNLGRFMSPDPKIPSVRHLLNPQKWNKYAYTINNPLRYFDPDGLEEIEVQLRAFIPQKTVTDPRGRVFGGDNRPSTSAQNVTSRTSITVRIETDASKRPGNPIISATQPGTAGETRQLDANGNVINRATATTGLPAVTGSRDANGNPVLNFKQDTTNPLEPQSVTPGIRADLNVTVTQNASSLDVTGSVSGSPSFELNVGSTNIPLQTAPSSNVGFILGLFMTNTVQTATPLPPPPPKPPACATDKEKPCQ